MNRVTKHKLVTETASSFHSVWVKNYVGLLWMVEMGGFENCLKP
jgi:hypothetical protein